MATTFAQALKNHRVHARLTQEELAERAGISARAVSDLERGLSHAPRPATLALLAEALQLSEPERVAFRMVACGHGETPEAGPTRLSGLPAELTTFVGREREVVAVRGLLMRPDVRLLTLTGPGGAGKTRLAAEVASGLADRFPDGAHLVALAPVTDPALVASGIARVLGIEETAGRPLEETLEMYLRERESLLLLDNFEQVATAASLLARLLRTCPRLKLLVTSRVLLRLSAEHAYEVPPLAVPDRRERLPVERLREYEAVRLFVERARAARPDFELTQENAPAVGEICRRLDGLPLALELAAARARVLSPEAMLARLEQGLTLLTGGAIDLPPRQRTLRATLDWSYDLLDVAERRLLRRLAVFAGGFKLRAAQAVCWSEGEADVLEGISSLVDKSLVRGVGRADTEPRFGVLETVREYLLEKLEQSGEAEEVRGRHARHYHALAETAALGFRGQEHGRWLDELEAEHDNFRAALSWSLEGGDSELGQRMAGALYLFWNTRGYLSEGRRWLGDAVAAGAGSPATVMSKALLGIGGLAMAQGDLERARVASAEALRLAREAGDETLTMWALGNMSHLYINEGRYDAARQANEESLAIARAAVDERRVAYALNGLGEIARLQGEYGRAGELYKESLSLARQVGEHNVIVVGLINLGIVALHEGKPDKAKASLGESLRLAWSQQDHLKTIVGLAELAAVAVVEGDPLRAVRLWAATEARAEAIGLVFSEPDRIEYEPYLLPLRSELEDAEFRAAWTEGQAMSLERAVEYALGRCEA